MSDDLRDMIAAALADEFNIYNDRVRVWPFRVTPEQQASYADAVLAIPEIAEALALRALVYGGRCECEGKPWIRSDVPRCPDCIDGRKPGIVERLEAIHARLPWWEESGPLGAILADLRAAGNQGGPTT